MNWLAILAAVMLSHALAGPADARWPAVLEGFDQIRSQAFEKDQPDTLGAVYPPNSELLAHDKELLASYRRRGIRIEQMRMRLIEARVISVTPEMITMTVIDRLAEARIRLPDGTRRELPRDQPTRRLVELSLTEQGWRISGVTNE